MSIKRLLFVAWGGMIRALLIQLNICTTHPQRSTTNANIQLLGAPGRIAISSCINWWILSIWSTSSCGSWHPLSTAWRGRCHSSSRSVHFPHQLLQNLRSCHLLTTGWPRFWKKNSCILVTLWFAGSMLCYPYWNWLTSRDLHFWQNITNSIRWIFHLWSMFTRSSALSPSSPYSNQEFISPFHKLCDSLRKGAQGIAKRISFRNGTLSRWMMGIQSSGPPLHECNRILRVHRLAMLWQLNDLDAWMFNTFQLNGLWLFWNGCIPYSSFILQYQ